MCYAGARAEYLKDGKSENECERQKSAVVTAELACATHCIEKRREIIRLPGPDPFIGRTGGTAQGCGAWRATARGLAAPETWRPELRAPLGAQ